MRSKRISNAPTEEVIDIELSVADKKIFLTLLGYEIYRDDNSYHNFMFYAAGTGMICIKVHSPDEDQAINCAYEIFQHHQQQ